MTTIEYPITPLCDLRIRTATAPRNGREIPVSIEAGGRRLQPTPRFWGSLFRRYGLNRALFRYFGYHEVLQRVVEHHPGDRLRLCIEGGEGDGPGRLLAVSNPQRPILTHGDAVKVLNKQPHDEMVYSHGVLTSRHTPASGAHDFAIGPDQFQHRLVVEAPIDGFGTPRVYLSLLRLLCSNGAVGYARGFRSDIRIGDDPAHTLGRAVAHFDHDEGFAALRQRFESAQVSWASVHEVVQLEKLLLRLGAVRQLTRPRLVESLHACAGDLQGIYGLANLDVLPSKRQRMLPARCRVYDLLNFASEVASHHAEAGGRLRLQLYIGGLVSQEYDLERTAEAVPEFKDLLVNQN